MKKLQNQASKEDERWENYRLANSRFPKVRQAELSRQLELTNPQQGETIVEVGTGNGYLTFELAKAVGKSGKIITFDYQKPNIDFVEEANQGKFPIQTIHQTLDYNLSIPEGSIDKVSTIATLHHYDDRSKHTGANGRQRIINEFYRVIKKGGQLVIADIADKTPNQEYFDNVLDNHASPGYCHPRGHPHDFLDEKLARELCEKAGFKDIEFRIEQVPLMFENEEQAKTFWHTVHNAKCSPDESLDIVKKHLPNWNKNGGFYVGWHTLYLTARK